MAKKKLYIIEYKYEGGHWHEYDKTFVEKWAETQAVRVAREHPEAQHRITQK